MGATPGGPPCLPTAFRLCASEPTSQRSASTSRPALVPDTEAAPGRPRESGHGALPSRRGGVPARGLTLVQTLHSGAHRSPPKLGAKARPPQWPEPVPTRTLMALHEHKSRPHLVNGCGVLGEVAPLPGARERSCEHFPTCLQQGTRKNPERRLGGRPSP